MVLMNATPENKDRGVRARRRLELPTTSPTVARCLLVETSKLRLPGLGGWETGPTRGRGGQPGARHRSGGHENRSLELLARRVAPRSCGPAERS